MRIFLVILILMIIAFIADILTIIFIKKKRIKIALIAIFSVLFLLPLFLWGLSSRTEIFIGNTDLSKINVSSYSVDQNIDSTELLIADSAEDSLIRYKLAGSNLVYITVSKSSNKITLIEAYYQEENTDNDLLQPEIDGLLVGNSIFSETTSLLGDRYCKALFSDAWEKVITYKDSGLGVKLKCCFNRDILVAAFLENL